MKLSQRLRKIWHDVFYKRANDQQVDFALKCQDVTLMIDLHQKPTTYADKFRYQLHLSLCQACKNYETISQTLSEAAKQKSLNTTLNKVEELNAQLLEKFSSKVMKK